MIYRIVRLHFRAEETGRFETLFQEKQAEIQAFEGCRRADLLRDTKIPEVYYTLSEWDSEAHLDRYRFSEFFKNTWQETKSLFVEKAQAFSADPVFGSKGD